MENNSTDIKKGSLENIVIELGAPILIEPSGLGEKIKTFFLGMEKKSYLITALSPLLGEDKLIYDYLYKGNRTKIFYTKEGIVNGFVSQVIAYTTSPFRHIYFTYPTDAEICNLRQSERTDCHLPAAIDCDGSQIRGMIVNLSGGGCAMCIDWDDQLADAGIVEGASFVVKFHLSKESQDRTVTCKIMNMRKRKDLALLGMKFEVIDDQTTKWISDFINHVQRYKI